MCVRVVWYVSLDNTRVVWCVSLDNTSDSEPEDSRIVLNR